ncbi:MAG: hypothetical protein IH948_00255 [Bacteroidetes bacterium]|nr:hypothetical protein [Bacteroidota bacterium]
MGRSWCPYCGYVFYDSRSDDIPMTDSSAHLCEGKAQAIAMKKKYKLEEEDLK